MVLFASLVVASLAALVNSHSYPRREPPSRVHLRQEDSGAASTNTSASYPYPGSTAVVTTLTTAPVPEPTPDFGGCAVNFTEVLTVDPSVEVRLGGSLAQLGNWTVEGALRLTNTGTAWNATMPIAPGTAFQYKYVQIDSSGNVTWETDPRRRAVVDATCRGTVALEDYWS